MPVADIAKLIGKGNGDKLARSMIVFAKAGDIINVQLAPYFHDAAPPENRRASHKPDGVRYDYYGWQARRAATPATKPFPELEGYKLIRVEHHERDGVFFWRYQPHDADFYPIDVFMPEYYEQMAASHETKPDPKRPNHAQFYRDSLLEIEKHGIGYVTGMPNIGPAHHEELPTRWYKYRISSDKRET